MAFIKKRFGIEMVNQHFSTIKSQEQRKADGIGPAIEESRAAQRKLAEARSERTAPQASPSATGAMGLMDDLASVKSLVKKLVAEQVRKIFDRFE